jgi:hypothetical protein
LGAALQADGETRFALSGLKHQKEKRSMDHFAGLDVSVKDTSVCIVDDTGKIVREVKVASEPDALLAVLRNVRPWPRWPVNTIAARLQTGVRCRGKARAIAICTMEAAT